MSPTPHTRVRHAWALLLLHQVAKVSAPSAFAGRAYMAAGTRIWLTVQALEQSDQRLLTPAQTADSGLGIGGRPAGTSDEHFRSLHLLAVSYTMRHRCRTSGIKMPIKNKSQDP
jgi:hypothetical protein